MSSNQLWGPEEDIPDLISDDSEEEEALVARQPRAPRPDAEALLTLGVSLLTCARLHGLRLQCSFEQGFTLQLPVPPMCNTAGSKAMHALKPIYRQVWLELCFTSSWAEISQCAGPMSGK